MADVDLAGVSRVYPGGVVAVKDLNLEIRDHELLVLLGPSGCGKTTILRLIAGLEHASAGTVRIGGRIVNGDAPRRRNIAMVFQSQALYPHLTVRGNLAFGLNLRYGGWFQIKTRGEIEARVRQVAASLGIEGLLDRKPAELSGGQRQRVALGRAIVREPAAFLFDEPLSNLDAQLRLEMRRELKRLHTRLATTMVYVTHDQVEALALADRVAVMEGGRVRQVGLAQEVYDRPADRWVAAFVGNPPMNLIEGEWGNSMDSGETPGRPGGKRFIGKGWTMVIDERWLDGLGGEGHGPAKSRVTLGIRSEDVYLGDRYGGDGYGGDGYLRDGYGGDGYGGDGGSGVLAGAAEVVAVEPLGESTMIQFGPLGESGGPLGERGGAENAHVLWARAPARGGPRPGERVRVWFDARRIHAFDALTGMNLRGVPPRRHEKNELAFSTILRPLQIDKPTI
ncbi:MAG TPA: ABC transporter ATP-binding protein [Pirellulales bacterium]|nr:ABC transporter ATP-binding protein [Pirellulales bacterium]